MLTLGKVSTGAAASNYYEGADDYYHQDRSPSQWSGGGAERLGLVGEVDAKTFRDLLDGRMPDGMQIHNAAEGRRGGTDFTFSAPKSVSMQALIGGDVRLIDAHETAVARAMVYAEGLASCRTTECGVTHSEKSGNLIVASFRHDLSRAADPNLHTHAVAINGTQRADGQWRAVEQPIYYHQQKLVGALYRAELALEVQKLGYEIRLMHGDGRFELAHFSRTQLEAFSQRSAMIEKSLAEQGKTRDHATAREKEIAALATRERKGEVDRQALRDEWHQKSCELGINYVPVTCAPQLSKEVRERATRAAVDFSVAHSTERQAIVSDIQLIRAALEHGTGRTDLAKVRAEIDRRVANGELIRAGERFTTDFAQQREREMLSVEIRGRGAVAPVLMPELVERVLAGTSLNAGQRAAAGLVVSSDNRVVAIQGSAGTGKTFMLNEARQLAESHGFQLLGLAPSAAAARELGGAGIDSRTLASFLASERNGLSAKTVLVVDEAGMVSAKDMHAILLAAEGKNSRVVLVGDTQQLKAVEAGKPFAQLQEAGMRRVEVGEIQRQSDAQLKRAVEFAAQGQVDRSLAVLDKQVREIAGSAERHSTVARDYVALDPAARGQTLIVVGTRSARTAINMQVRAELGLAGKGIEVNTLERKDLTAAQARSSLSYQPGDMVQAQKTYDSLGLRRGEFARVVDGAAGKVTLQQAAGVTVEWRPALQPNLTAYHTHSREFAVSDQVRFTANDHSQGLINGERAMVVGIDVERQTITLEKSDGGRVSLDATKPLHLDHGYCSTIHAAQGQTVDRVLVEADTRSATANESAFYVAISRARESATIYTDDKSLLPDVMGREDKKEAALDLSAASLKANSKTASEMER